MERDERPDVVLVVGDCLRHDEFEREWPDHQFLRALRRQSVAFPKCTSVSNWTIPAHVSLFTGLQPSEHRVHRLGHRVLPPHIPTLAASLSDAGYATYLISANHNLDPETGFGRGFDYHAYGRWGETALRITSPLQPPYDSRSESAGDPLRKHILEEDATGQWQLVKWIAEMSPRFPWLLDGVSRVYAGLAGFSSKGGGQVAPWVEPALSRCISETPASQPMLSVINLMDCHEPYLPLPSAGMGIGNWLRLETCRQDVSSWRRGRWSPSSGEYATLLELYRLQVRALCRRLEAIARIQREARDWENTLFIVTSDHGQAFGEHRQLFHGVELFEPIVRVPLWVRFPGQEGGGATALGEASLVDIYPTILDAVGVELQARSSGIPLQVLVEQPRSGATLSAADVLFRSGLTAGSDTLPRPPQITAQDSDHKLILDCVSGRVRAFQVDRDPGESRDLWGESAPKLRRLYDLARRTGEAMVSSGQPAAQAASGERIRSWGYLD
jgi:arylsulfatase A-like enzyme